MIVEIFRIVVHNLSSDWKVDQKTVIYAHLSVRTSLFSILLIKKLDLQYRISL